MVLIIFGRAPIINKSAAIACYFAGFIIMSVNIIYSKAYFHSALGGKDTDLMWWTTWAVAAAMGLYEAVCLGLLTTPSAHGFLFSIPRKIATIQDENQRQISKWGAFGLAMVLGILCVVVYYVDFTTTIGGLGIGDILAARFMAGCLVFGSEVMFIGGNALMWLALVSEAESADVKKRLEDEIKRVKDSNGTVSSGRRRD